MAIGDTDDAGIVSSLRRRMASALGFTHGGARDLYGQLGYPTIVTAQMMMNMYQRNDIASRIVRSFPQATWRERPVVRDEAGDSDEADNDSYSPFFDATRMFLKRTRALQYLERADRLSAIGQFGVLLMGFSDGANLDQPVSRPAKLIYLAAYGEPNVMVSQWVTSDRDPRFGLPLLYTLQTASLQGKTAVRRSLTVHHSRVIHVAEHLDQDEVYGTPRLLPVYNRMLDLEKVVGGSAETFWLNARPGLSLSADKDAKISDTALADMKQQASDYEHQLRRIMAMQGITASNLTAAIADPKPNVETLLQLISGAVGIPMRILTGSERGELSSSQDENNWAARIDERQNNFATPSILMPFVQAMMDTGNLPKPEGDWWVEWPDSSALSPQARADIGARQATAIKDYLTVPGADLLVPYEEFRTDMLGLAPKSEYDVVEVPDDETDPEVQAQFDASGNPVAPAPGAEIVAGADAAQDTALNGAQIAALRDIAIAVGDGTMDAETAIQLILVGFPGVDEATARAIIMPMEDFETTEPAPSPLMLPGAVPTAADPGEETIPTAEDVGKKPKPDAGLVVARALTRRAMWTNARPRSLYVRRDVLNAEAIRNHFREQGIETMTPAEEMHVTITFSRRPIDWMCIESDTDWNGSGTMTIGAGGPRMLDTFGADGNCLVQLFNSSMLSWRHQAMRDRGTSWDFPEYQPHITITYALPASVALDELVPWQGEIVLGPEIFEEVTEGWGAELVENRRY